MSNPIMIKTEIDELDFYFIHRFITKTHWAMGRTEAEMLLCMKNSFNYGIFIRDEQIGYARVVSDLVQFAYLMDVFIDEKFRGKGYSKILLEFIFNDKKLSGVKTWRLATNDAHGLYTQFGFKSLAHPEKMMELLR